MQNDLLKNSTNVQKEGFKGKTKNAHQLKISEWYSYHHECIYVNYVLWKTASS